MSSLAVLSNVKSMSIFNFTIFCIAIIWACVHLHHPLLRKTFTHYDSHSRNCRLCISPVGLQCSETNLIYKSEFEVANVFENISCDRLGVLTKCIAFCSYLLILDRTNWRTNILTGLLIPYIFFCLPSLIFNVFRWSSTL